MLRNYQNMFILVSDLAKLVDNNETYNWRYSFHISLKKLYEDLEIEYKYKEKIKKVESLLYTINDCFDKYSNYIITNNEKQKRLDTIFNKKQVEQRTEAWYEETKHVLTASEFYKLFESDRTRGTLVVSKKQPVKFDLQKAVPTHTMTPFDWGIRFEPVVKNYIECAWKCKVYDCGRIRHETNSKLAASPDGIIIECDDEKKVGRLIEIKCPYTRKSNNIIPFPYWVQMQIQMEVTNLVECEYIEVEILSKNPKQLDLDLSGNYIDKKELYLLLKDCTYVYAYSISERDTYVSDGYELIETIEFAITNIFNEVVKRDEKWYETTLPIQEEFWKDVNSDYKLPEPKYKKHKVEKNECLITEE